MSILLNINTINTNSCNLSWTAPQGINLNISPRDRVSLFYLAGLSIDNTTGNIQSWSGESAALSYTVPAISDAVMVDIGYKHGIALKADGTIQTWGDATENASANFLNIPSGLTQAIFVSAGWNFSAAVTPGGTVYCWGENGQGQCNVPTGLTDIVSVKCGVLNTIALKSDGTIYCWGDNTQGQCNIPTNLTATEVAMGMYTAIALGTDGTGVSWGQYPYSVANCISVAAGRNQVGFVKNTGYVQMWGQNNVDINTVPIEANSGVKGITIGDQGVIAVKDDNSTVVWGTTSFEYYTPTGLVVDSTNTNISTEIDSFNLYRNTQLVQNVAANIVNYNDLGLNDNTIYDYYIDSLKANSDIIETSNTITGITFPNAPTTLVVTNANSTSLTLSWEATTGPGHDVLSYNIYDGTNLLTSSSTKTAQITGLTPATLYQLNVKANNTTGTSDASTSLNVTLITIPEGLSVNTVTAYTFDLSWDVVAGADSYEVYEGANLLESPSTNSVTISSLTPNTTYDITVKAVNTTMTTEASNVLQVTTLQIAPTTPTNFTAINISHDKLTLTWDAVVSADAYEVYKDTNLIDGNVAGTSFLMDGLNAETTYNFAVKSKNGIGTSTEAITTATTLAAGTSSKRVALLTPIDNATDVSMTPTLTWDLSPASPGTLNIAYTTGNTTEATLSWTAVTDAVSYNLYLNDALVTNIAATSTSYKFINILTTVNNDLGVSAINVNGTESLISYKTTYYTGS